jgi:hypothetical protein
LALRLFFTAALASSVLADELCTYLLRVELAPERHAVEVEARVWLPESLRAAGVEFELNGALAIAESSPALREVGGAESMKRYALGAQAAGGWLELRYAGAFDFGLSDQKEEYTRGFRETLGIVGPEGVFLSGSSRWVPTFDVEFVNFELEVESPAGWHVISQGDGTSGDGDGHARWNSAGALEEIYLVGGPLQRWSDSAGAIETLVYLHADEESLAVKYLDATARYLEMYRGLLGPYPYGKFALVENFWETGYGMASFTLLGEQVIRFPFILHSSYPHEILHNWWGNSVFVDYEGGNWCEGLTAYMADHLIQEQRGEGALYRRSTLQKYRDYVKEGRDFPLREFRSRHSAATEAVGYGKSLMGFHMLRRELGDEAFAGGLSSFYRENRGRKASFDDLRVALEAESKADLRPFFESWLEREGAPQLALASLMIQESEGRFFVHGKIEQRQAQAPFALEVPVVLALADGSRLERVALEGRSTEFTFIGDSPPSALAVDPEFDVFRLLDPRETPPSIGQIFGEPEILAVLPSAAGQEGCARYRLLVEGWVSAEHALRIVLDNEIDSIPADRAAWVLGRDNRFAELFDGWRERARGIDPGGNPLLDDGAPTLPGHSQVVIARHPLDVEKAVGWIVLGSPAALPGLARKLPHYGKYSYLAFAGDEPTNVLKGQWATDDSPLVWQADPAAPVELVFEQRRALAEYPSAFSQRALREHVEWLAAPEREGRGLGSPGLEASAEYIAAAFERCGLEPAGDDGGWFQEFSVSGPDGELLRTKNVVALLRGKDAAWAQQSTVLSAHYDHLGRGWPDVHAGDEGSLHPGANDNASGVAVLLELAKSLGQRGGGRRNLLLIAFSAEEASLAGSRHYVEHPALPLEQCLGVINLDAVGVLGEQPIALHGTGTAYEWPHIFRGCGFVTGIPSKNVATGAEGSDQWSFIERGVPGVQVFTGIPAHYHRPGDTPETLDYAGLVKVATFLDEAVAYMLEREEPFQVTIEGVASASTAAAKTRRGVAFGSIPEYGYAGGGMLLSGVSAGSPAEKAGLLAGDVLIRIDEREVEDTRGFAEILKSLEEGQTVRATVLRGGVERTFDVTLVAR